MAWTRRDAIKVGGAAVGAGMGALTSEQGKPGARRAGVDPKRRRNLLIVIGDDLNRFDIAPYVPTPNLERMRRFGVDLTRAYAPAPLCSATRYGLLLGAYARRGGLGRIIGSITPPPLENPGPIVDQRGWCLPRAFAAAGFRTALFGKWHLGFPHRIEFPSDPAPDGTGTFYQPQFFGFHDWLIGSPSNLNAMGSGYSDWLRIDNGRRSQESGFPELLRLDGILDWWSRHAEQNKFCVWSMNLPHAPYTVPPALALPPGFVPDAASARGRYEAMVVSMDYLLGQLLRQVDLENTLCVWLSDNGTPPNVAGPNQRADRVKKTTFEGGIRVPLRMMGAGLPANVTYPHVSSLVDLGPSLAAYLGAPAASMDGRTGLFDAIRNRTPYREWAMAERFINRGDEPPKIMEEPNSELAIVTERFKYRVVDEVARVYDLQEDPSEDTPIHPSDPGVASFVAFAQDVLGELPPRFA